MKKDASWKGIFLERLQLFRLIWEGANKLDTYAVPGLSIAQG